MEMVVIGVELGEDVVEVMVVVLWLLELLVVDKELPLDVELEELLVLGGIVLDEVVEVFVVPALLLLDVDGEVVEPDVDCVRLLELEEELVETVKALHSAAGATPLAGCSVQPAGIINF